jgi:predicted dehydrogenase
LPLHLHAPASIAALKAGLHVLTEKLMGHSVHECKEMARAAAQTGLLLATGHQRHYNILYRQAVKLTRAGLLGQVHYIRAQWHRGNLPGADSWQQPMPRKVKPDDPLAEQLDRQLARYQRELKKAQADFDEAKKAGRSTANLERRLRDLQLLLDQVAAQIRDEVVDAAKYGYQDLQIKDAAGKVLWNRPAIEELIRWRLWDRTGGGLMAELGSHQLDAASIFISALFEGEKKQIPLSVTALAHRPLFPPDRDVEDHVYCIFEFPAPGHDPHDPRAKDQKITVQYASINGNGFGGYGETVLGTEGTLLLETEKEALLFKGGDTGSKTRVVLRGKKPVLVADKAGDVEAAAIGQLAVLPAERGYTEQIEHWAWCIRNPAPENQPRCGPKVALGDAVIALTTNIAARKGARIDFDPAWFEIDSDATPEGIKPDLSRYS